MLPRGKLDIGWTDLLFGVRASLHAKNRGKAQQRVEAIWGSGSDTLACLSVRSGFDALLQALAFPPGSEILTSALTIRDMVRIIEHHGLIPVPIDLDPRTLSLASEDVERPVTPRTKALLIAHVFGSRMPMDDIVAIAKRHDLLVIEDCAQAYVGAAYQGHPGSDVVMFSFGPIKTNTALGGALLRVKESALLETVRGVQERYPVQGRRPFLRRVCKYGVLKALTMPWVFGVFVAMCRAMGKSHDEIISGAVRGFPGSELFGRLRQQPSYPLLALLERRLRTFDPVRIDRRIAAAKTAIGLMPRLERPGGEATPHSHWVFPILSAAPDDLMHHLWRHGFDATRGASSLAVVGPPADRPELSPDEVSRMMEGTLYLPLYPGLSDNDLRRLAHAVTSFGSHQARLALGEESTERAASRSAV